ncbi:sulfate permease [Pseudomonas putida S11]|nr:sulfate permease [Pseudomonas putida S11]
MCMHLIKEPAMIAVREAWNAGLFKREHWMRNLVSGLIVGVVALPLAMAFAIASGVRSRSKASTRRS